MGKKRDPKVPILPSCMRRGTALSTSAKLDSPSVMSQFDSPQLHATSAESGNMSDTFDDASTTFETTGSLGSFIEEQITAAARFSGVEIPVTQTPIGKIHNLTGLKEKLLEDDYVILDDDLCRELNECADSDPATINKLLAKHSLKNKFTPDPTFATSPILITDPDYDFSLELSLISTVEADPFYGRENDDAIEHLTKLTELGSLFTTDERIRNFYVTKLLPFSLKRDARAWYDAIPCGSIQSPQDMAIYFVDKYFPAHMQHAALQRIYNYKQLQDEHLPKAWGRFCSLLKARPGHEIHKNELLDIFYAGLTDGSKSYLDSCAGCVFRQRTPDDAEELMDRLPQTMKIGPCLNHLHHQRRGACLS